MVECPKCNRQVQSYEIEGFLWWKHCILCDNQHLAFLYDVRLMRPTNPKERQELLEKTRLCLLQTNMLFLMYKEWVLNGARMHVRDHWSYGDDLLRRDKKNHVFEEDAQYMIRQSFR